MAVLAAHSQFQRTDRTISFRADRASGVTAEARIDAHSRVAYLVVQSHGFSQTGGPEFSLARRRSQCAWCSVVAEEEFDIILPVDAAHKGDRLLTGPKGPFDRNNDC